MNLNILSTILAISLSVSLTACNNKPENPTQDTSSQQSTTNEVEVAPKLPADAPIYKVSTISSFEPFVFKDEYGKVTGFDIDIMNAIAEKEKFGIEFFTVPWEGIFETVTSGKKDIIASAVVITPEREEILDFSEPYTDAGRAALVKEDLKDVPFKDLVADDNKKFVYITGSRAGEILKSLGVKDENMITTETQFLAIQAVVTGKADAAFEDASALRYYSHEFEGLSIIDYDEHKEYLGFAVNEGNAEVLAKINSGLEKIKADGTYDEIYNKWFGSSTK